MILLRKIKKQNSRICSHSNELIKGIKTNHLRADNALIENGSSEPTNTTTLFELREARTNFSAGVSVDKHQ